MRTYSAKPCDIAHPWFVVDAEGVVLGRLAAIIAMRLRGKHKPMYTPNLDCGDNIVIVNADKVRLTGNKRRDKVFHWHTGFPGGIKLRTMEQRLSGRFPERVIEKAVERMLPKTKMGREVIRKLRIYAGPEHPHSAQQPAALDIKAMNTKNGRAS
jgi:large subunit ribosomal protein L13